MKRKTLVFVCLLVIALMVASTVPAGAKKPPKDPPPDDGGGDPTGTLFFGYPDSGTYWVWSMDPDGSRKAKEHTYKGEYYAMSRSQHNGHWWYIGFENEGDKDPDGTLHWDLFARRDDGQAWVQLTDDPDMDFDRLGVKPVWGIDDDTISWSAVMWTQDGSGNAVVQEAGVYTADISWSNGDITGIGTISQLVDCGVNQFGSDAVYCQIREGMDWSPDGTYITYMKHDTSDGYSSVCLYEISTGTETKLVRGYNPTWSPDGTLISFGQDRSILVIKPDGTGNTTLAASSYKGPILKTARYQTWSPDSKYLMYQIYTINYNKVGTVTSDIYIVDMNGNSDCLTTELTSTDGKTPVGWR